MHSQFFYFLFLANITTIYIFRSLQLAGGEYKLYPRQLNIVWGNDPRYWRIPAGK